MALSQNTLKDRRATWKRKEILRRLYLRWYGLKKKWMRPGKTVELGGGSGNLKDFLPDAVSTDIVYEPWLDAVLDAQHLPFKSGSIDNVVLFDVLHHLEEPARFFGEAARVLSRGGRILMMEPYVSVSSYPVYRWLHHEGLSWDVNPLGRKKDLPGGKDPFEGNQAVPRLLFGKYRSDFLRMFPCFHVVNEEKLDCLIYPLSGGFHNPSLCPVFLWRPLRFAEELLRPVARFLAFRVFVVLEKRA